ncbi:tetratricopeptide repeat protein [Actinomyces minihominis]|uniref:tetratricopeptide repeat protein n=1 Tax=Actinomyces minihominis TaxID=2002838 RepID=UPI000C08D5D4|nr:tetratricopeptide repeat protein [Actinomyces minihominis]
MSSAASGDFGGVDLSHMVPTQGGGLPPAVPQQTSDSTRVEAPLVVEVNAETFETQMALSQQVPVILVLYSPSQLASKQTLEALENLARWDAGAFQLAKVNVEENPQLAAAFQAQTVPAAFGILGRRPIPLFEGAASPAQASEIVTEMLAVAPQMGVTGRLSVSEEAAETPMPEEHRAAREAEAEGNWAGAVKAWKKVLDKNPADKEAKLALARAKFERRFEAAQAEGKDSEGSSPTATADRLFAAGDEAGAFDILLEALTASTDGDEKEKLRKQLVGLFPIATDQDALGSARTRLATHLMV